MNKRPLAVISIFFISGIILARFFPYPVKFLYIFVVTLILASLTLTLSLKGRGKASNIFLLLSITSFATLLYVNYNTFPNNHISHFLGEEKLKTEIVGVIRSPALTRKPYYGKISSMYLFGLEVMLVNGEWFTVNGLSQIRIQTEKDYGYGDRLLVREAVKKPAMGVIASEAKQSHKKKIASSPSAPRNDKKSFNYREYLERQNIFALINTKENNVTVLARDYKSNPILKYTYLIREKLKNLILEKMPLESGAFMRAILLGDRSELPTYIQTAFKNSGTMHILPTQCLWV